MASSGQLDPEFEGTWSWKGLRYHTRQREEGESSQTLHLASPESANSFSCSCFLLWFPPPFSWLCFGAGKRGIQASKPPGTAGLAKHRGILERVCKLITLPSLISAASLWPRRHSQHVTEERRERRHWGAWNRLMPSGDTEVLERPTGPSSSLNRGQTFQSLKYKWSNTNI